MRYRHEIYHFVPIFLFIYQLKHDKNVFTHQKSRPGSFSCDFRRI